MATSAPINELLDEVIQISRNGSIHRCFNIEDAVAKAAEQAEGKSVIVFTSLKYCNEAARQLAPFGFLPHHYNLLKSERGFIFKDTTTIRLVTYTRGSHALRGYDFDHIFVGLF